jgi:hypothetical protein
MSMRRPFFVAVVAVVVALAGVGVAAAPSVAAPKPTTITLVTHDSFAVSKPCCRRSSASPGSR